MGSTISSLFFAEEVLPQDEKNIFILGIDGSGTSTICKYLSSSFSSARNNKNEEPSSPNEKIISTFENPVSGFERACIRYLIPFPHPTVSSVNRNVTWVSYHGQQKYSCRAPWHLRFQSNANTNFIDGIIWVVDPQYILYDDADPRSYRKEENKREFARVVVNVLINTNIHSKNASRRKNNFKLYPVLIFATKSDLFLGSMSKDTIKDQFQKILIDENEFFDSEMRNFNSADDNENNNLELVDLVDFDIQVCSGKEGDGLHQGIVSFGNKLF